MEGKQKVAYPLRWDPMYIDVSSMDSFEWQRFGHTILDYSKKFPYLGPKGCYPPYIIIMQPWEFDFFWIVSQHSEDKVCTFCDFEDPHLWLNPTLVSTSATECRLNNMRVATRPTLELILRVFGTWPFPELCNQDPLWKCGLEKKPRVVDEFRKL